MLILDKQYTKNVNITKNILRINVKKERTEYKTKNVSIQIV